METKLHIGYFADGPWGHRSFNKIMQDDSLIIDFVCVRNDRKDTVLMELAEKNHKDILFTPDINSKEFIERLQVYPANLYVSMSFNQIFGVKIQKLPRNGIINCHAGKLPFYRGRNILNWALINDEKEFGITVHYVDNGVDTGDIILQKTYEINDQDSYKTLLEKAYGGCPDILYQAIKQIQSGNVHSKKQSEISKAGLYCGMRKVGDEILNWNQSSREIFNFIRAITEPGPCACSFIDGKKILFYSSEMIPEAPIYKGVPGQVLLKDKNFLLVKTGDSYIRITSYEGLVKIGDRMEMH